MRPYLLICLLPLWLCACSADRTLDEPAPTKPAEETARVEVDRPPQRLYRYPQAPAADRVALLDEYFAAIRDLPFDYGKVGSVLEAIAYTQFLDIYPPPEFELLHSVAYHEADGRTIGELDLVAVEANTDEVVFVGEVKLSRSPGRAAEKAAEQLQRVQDYLQQGKVARFTHPGHWDRVLRSDQFGNGIEYARIGSHGSLQAGFEYETDITRAEGDMLQRRVLESARPQPAATGAP